MKYSVVIPAHNSRATLERCIRCILGSRFDEPYELIVVDDASRDDTPDIAGRLGAKVIRNQECRGPAFARNLGAKFAEGGILIFIDSDVLIFEDTLQKIDDFFRAEKDFSALSCNFDPACEMKDPVSRYKHFYTGYCFLNQPREVCWAFSATLAVRKDAFEKAGGFDEGARVLEDELFGRKLSRKGYRIAFGRRVWVRHVRYYSFFDFLREEVRRSRAFAGIKAADFLNGTKHKKDNVAASVKFSLILFPFLLAGVFYAPRNFLFGALMLAVFCAGNAGFFSACKKQFGAKFMFQAFFILLLDCLLCWIGIFGALWELLPGNAKGREARGLVCPEDGRSVNEKPDMALSEGPA